MSSPSSPPDAGHDYRPDRTELNDPIYVDVDGAQAGTLPATRVHLPDDDFVRGDARLGRTEAGCVCICLGRKLHLSDDGGQTWQTRDLPVASGGFGVVGADSLVVFTADPTPSTLRSTDLGRTWSEPIPLDIGAFDKAGGWTHIMQVPEGPALMTVQCYNEDRATDPRTGAKRRSTQLGLYDHVYRSSDSGRSWHDRTGIARDSAETSLLWLRSGRMMAAIRVQRVPQRVLPSDDVEQFKALGLWNRGDGMPFIKHAFLADSDDLGRTWTNLRLAPCDRIGPDQVAESLCPSELIQLPDGRVLWIHHRRHQPRKGVYARVSHDDGRTWTGRRYWLRNLRDQRHGVYPASTLLDDGTILTVTSANHGNRAMAIRWKLPPGD